MTWALALALLFAWTGCGDGSPAEKTPDLARVWTIAADDAWAVGDAGTRLH